MSAPAVRTATIPGLPACPTWCAGDCRGGEVEHLGDGLTVTTDRLHEKTLATFVAADGDSYAGRDKVTVQLFVERYDTVDPAEAPVRTQAMLDLDQRNPVRRFVRVAMTAADLRALAAAATEAAELLDAADAAEGR